MHSGIRITWPFPLLPLLALLLLTCAHCGDDSSSGDPEAMEREMFELLNDARADNGLQPLLADPGLTEAARQNSQDMADRNFFSHVNPDGESVMDRVSAAGVEDYGALGENIAMNQGHDDPVRTAHEALLASADHRANILSDAYTHLGIGIAADGDTYYFTQVFASLP
ncbi:MAG: CAP domain-containing protein [bacterium]